MGKTFKEILTRKLQGEHIIDKEKADITEELLKSASTATLYLANEKSPVYWEFKMIDFIAAFRTHYSYRYCKCEVSMEALEFALMNIWKDLKHDEEHFNTLVSLVEVLA